MLPDEAPAVARFWHDAWHLAHAGLVPDALTRLRTPGDFTARLPGFGDGLRVAGPTGAPRGLCAIREELLAQIYVCREAMGTGLAQQLLNDGETRIHALGHGRARLHCVIGNDRAIQFYRQAGWQETGRETARLDTSSGTFEIETFLFTKDLPLIFKRPT